MSNDVTEDPHRIDPVLDRMFQRADSLPDSADPCTGAVYRWHETPLLGPWASRATDQEACIAMLTNSFGSNVMKRGLPITCIRRLSVGDPVLVEGGADSVVAFPGDHDIPSLWRDVPMYLCGMGARSFVVQFFTPGYVEKLARFPYKIVGRGWVICTKTRKKMYAIVYKGLYSQVAGSESGKHTVS